jgi:taurine dioxygenase
MPLEVRALNKPLGAEIFGFNPSIPLDKESKHCLVRALRRHLLLVFRGGPEPSAEEFIRFGKEFGELAPGAEIFGDVSQYPEIIPITNELNEHGEPIGTASSVQLNWHHDYSYLSQTAKETFLHAITIPKERCNTHFSDSYSALESLPIELGKAVRQLSALHDINGSVPEEDHAQLEGELAKKRERHQREGRSKRGSWRQVHPMVKSHPESGREVLYVSKGMTSRVEGIPEKEGTELLETLFHQQTQREFVYTHKWQPGDMLLFDSFGVLHARDSFKPSSKRFIRQMSTVVF